MGAPPPIRDPHTGCLLWQGTVNSTGYATEWTSAGPRQAHVEAWKRANPGVVIKAGQQVDHVCFERACVQPAHLELVSQGENLRRRSWAHRSRRTRCLKGHDLFLDGRRTRKGGTICLVCSGVKQCSSKGPR